MLIIDVDLSILRYKTFAYKGALYCEHFVQLVSQRPLMSCTAVVEKRLSERITLNNVSCKLTGSIHSYPISPVIGQFLVVSAYGRFECTVIISL